MRRTFRTRESALVAACLAVIVTSSALAGASWGPHPHPMGEDAAGTQIGPLLGLDGKADEALRQWLWDDGQGPVRVLVAGHPHTGLEEIVPLDRREATDLLAYKSQRFFDDVTAQVLEGGGEVHTLYPLAPAVSLSAGLSSLQALAALDAVAQIALVEPDSLSITTGGTLVPTLPVAPDREDPEGPRAKNTQGRQMMQADDAWALGYQGEGVRVASISTGVDADHEAFRHENGTSRVLAWADCSSGTCDTSGAPFDDHGHGTYTTASAVGSAGYDDPDHGTFEEAGSAPGAGLVAVKFLSSTGGGTWEAALASIQWAFDQDADITLNAWGAPCSNTNTGLYNMIETTTELGMLSVFAVGGGGPGEGTVSFPACMEATVSIGAVNGDETARSSSARGPCTDPSTGETFLCPDAVALGEAVRSAVPRGGTCSFCDPSGYGIISGTSPAAALATGYFAVAEGMKRDITGSPWDTASRAEREVLNATAKDLGPDGPDDTYGYGLPQLLNVHAILNATDEAVILDRFEVSDEEIHMGESTTLLFSVRNLGGAQATGDFLAELVHPDGSVETLADDEIALGLLDNHEVTHGVTATGDLIPGNYTFRASFDYSWTNGTGEEKSGLVEHEGGFTVNRVFLEMELEGLPEETGLGSIQSLSFDLASTGNAPARDVRLEFTVPDAYLFLPGGNFHPLEQGSLYADPAPDRVIGQSNPPRTVLVWDIGDLGPGDSFSFTSELLAKDLGEHRFVAVVKFQDDGGGSWSQLEVFRQNVSL